MKSPVNNEIPSIETFMQLLKNHGLKATPQRLAVHQAMISLEHACADTVKSYIDSIPGLKITTASVYGILTLMSETGIYTRMSSPDSKTYYDVCFKPHAHLYDTRNCEYINITDDELTESIENHFKRRRFKGYSIDHVEIKLICHPTKKNKKT